MSTFYELYGDFKDATKIYTEKLDVTELAFMRMLTRGVQTFQRETEYIETVATVLYNQTDQAFMVPTDFLRLVEIKDENYLTVLIQSHTQYTRNLELAPDYMQETPTDYGMRMRGGEYRSERVRIANIYNRTIYIYPYQNDTKLYVWYIPDLHAISEASPQWNYNTNNLPAGWYPVETNFQQKFQTTTINEVLAPYEDAFLAYAIASFIRSQGSANYKVYEEMFWNDVERAKMNKPDYFKEGVREYMISPWS